MFAQAVKDYLDKTLALQTQMTPWANATAMPFLLRERYDFFTLFLLGTQRLLMAAKDKKEETPAVVRSHVDMAKQHWNGEVIYVPQVITSFNRTRLIEQNISFIVPGRQLYLPDLGVALSEHFKKFAMTPIETYSPTTQMVILDALVNGSKEILNGATLAKKFNCSPMTITRVLNEIEETGLADVQTRGRERKIEFHLTKRELWEKAKAQLRDPVKMSETNYERNLDSRGYMIAGLTALSHYSGLAEPEEKTYATYNYIDPKWLKRTRADYMSPPDWDPNQKARLEVWTYDPKFFAKKGFVDQFSLYLAFRNDQDERVEAALEEMMEKVEW
jgi:DNA-binding MarR family transcriptional regulator